MSKHQQLLLFEELKPLALRIARGFLRKLPVSVLREDLTSAAMYGLWDAIRKHPGAMHESFERYARVRIRGAILDELRTQDWLPRRARYRPGAKLSVVRIDDLPEWEQELAEVSNDTSQDALLYQAQVREKLYSLMEVLPERERFVAVEMVVKGRLLKDIAQELGLSEPRLSQIKKSIVCRMRNLMETNDGTIDPRDLDDACDSGGHRVSSGR